MGEAINLVENFEVEKVIFNCGPYNDLEQELIKVLDKKKIKYYSCIKELNIDNNKLYSLQTKEYDNENDNSNVIYTELNGYKSMFMGDAGVTTEKEIMNKYSLSDIDVLKVGHHGSKTSSGKEFIDEMNPKYSIISVGKNNRYGHSNNEILNNLEQSKIYRTDIDGSIMFLLNKTAARHLVDKLMGTGHKPDDQDFDEVELSALKEVGNIITGSYLNSLSMMTNLKLVPSIPFVAIDMAGAILSVPAIQFGMMGDKILLIETQFFDELRLSGYFILLPDVDGYKKILSSLGMGDIEL